MHETRVYCVTQRGKFTLQPRPFLSRKHAASSTAVGKNTWWQAESRREGRCGGVAWGMSRRGRGVAEGMSALICSSRIYAYHTLRVPTQPEGLRIKFSYPLPIPSLPPSLHRLHRPRPTSRRRRTHRPPFSSFSSFTSVLSCLLFAALSHPLPHAQRHTHLLLALRTLEAATARDDHPAPTFLPAGSLQISTGGGLQMVSATQTQSQR